MDSQFSGGGMKVFFAVIFLLCLRTATAQVASLDPRVLLVSEYTPAHTNYWTDYVVEFNSSLENVTRTAILGNCQGLVADPYFYMDTPMRALIEESIQVKADTLRATFALSGGEMEHYRRHLNEFAYWRLSPAERQSLLLFFEDKNLLQLIATREVLQDPPLSEARNGMGLAVAPIWLKTYFEMEGKLPELRQAIAAVNPQLLPAFDQVKHMEMHRLDDGDWLSKLADGLKNSMVEIEAAYWAAVPEEQQERAQQLMEHPYSVWLEEAALAESKADELMLLKQMGAKQELFSLTEEEAEIYEELTTIYPRLSPEKLLDFGAPDYVSISFVADCKQYAESRKP